ncbi:Amino acid permease/ SLC12A domain containing protein, partial [Tylopilus felleus]
SRDHVQRTLGKQHIQMITLAGSIGTGLFLGLGEVLRLTGPLGSLLVYLLVSSVTYATILSIGEMTAFAPISGSILLYVARWLDTALAFASCAIAIPFEITAFSTMITFWDKNLDHTPIYISVIIVVLLLINLFAEIFFSSLKIMLAVGLIIGGLVISLGGGPDHKYWQDPGPMVSQLEPGAAGRFLGLLVAITPAAFSLSGIELIAITAAEAKQPRTNIIKAMKTVIFRLLFFFIASVIVVGMLVPSNDPALFQLGESAGQSPFVIAFVRAGVKVLPSIVNAVLITSAFSTANTFVFTGSRILYGLAVLKKAPKILATCTKDGLPWVAVLVSWSFSFLAFMSVAASSATVFKYDLATMCGFIGWGILNLTYLRYYYGLRRQDIVTRGVYRSPLQPYAAIWAIFWICLFILMNDISGLWKWNTSSFIAAYINLPIFLALYLGYKLYYKTKMRPLSQLDFVSNIPTLEETGDEGILLEKLSFTKRVREMI